MSKIIIVGAGISGISMGRLLQERHNVLLLERSPKVGGLVQCEDVNGTLFHKVGGHVFNTKNRVVFDWFWSNFEQEKEFNKARRNAKILLNNKLIGYPIENHLFEFDKATAKKIIAELLNLNRRNNLLVENYTNFENFLQLNFGQTLYEIYFNPYNKKLWNTNLKNVPLEWLEGKLPMPDLKEILLSNVFKEEESKMVHSTFFYPKEGGSQFIANRLATGLEILNNCSVSHIKKIRGGFRVNDSMECKNIIFTGDIRRLGEIYETDSEELTEAMKAVKELRSNGTSNVLCECDDNNISWLYIPEPFTKAHRIIYTGNFSPANNGNKRKSCVVEFSGHLNSEDISQEIKKLPGNLKALKYNHEPNSYVIQEINTRNQIKNLKKLLEPQGFYLLGRFAEWEYYNMDKAIEMAFELSRKILNSPVND